MYLLNTSIDTCRTRFFFLIYSTATFAYYPRSFQKFSDTTVLFFQYTFKLTVVYISYFVSGCSLVFSFSTNISAVAYSIFLLLMLQKHLNVTGNVRHIAHECLLISCRHFNKYVMLLQISFAICFSMTIIRIKFNNIKRH